ncbi:OTU domain-containing protein 4 [Genypterus blacodes]|uniref:OTU domain-containing protein 4 n=1 Tax=Genypterus blacodes TaxID=154954 RepID=UPI003F772E06
MQSKEESGAERCMDEYLKSLGLHRKKIAKDGSCLFRAVAEQVLHCQSLHTEVRAKCVEYLRQNRESYEAFTEGDFEDYLCKLQDPQQWVGEVEINALAIMYKRDFLIFQEAGKPAVHITDNNFKEKVQLCFLNGNHYDSVYPIGRLKSAAVCQSILYEVLYEGVFKVDRGLLTMCQRVPRASDLLSDDNMDACASSDESNADADESLWVENGTSITVRSNSQSNRGRGRGRQLPERVIRSLNPTLLRNVQFDVWHKTKRAQQMMDYCIAAGMHYTVGDRCQVCLSGRSYRATIKEVSPSNGPVTVYIDDLHRKQLVPLLSLRSPSEENSWSTVVREKKISNGQGDWEERGGRGRGRGKTSALSSVAQAMTTPPGGHVKKQHSWPPHVLAEEQRVKTKKQMSLVESGSFGLKEAERLAKEEEEKNVALVEIQLRDEQSFPALGSQPAVQGEGGKRKGVDKRRSQRNVKTKSPVEDLRARSPYDGERPKSSSPPLSTTFANTTLSTTAQASPTLPVPNPSPKASTSSLTAAAAVTPASNTPAAAAAAAACPAPKIKPNALDLTPNPPPTSAAPTAKASTQSYASVTGGASPSLPVSPSASVFCFLNPALPAASSPPIPPALSSSPSSSSSNLPVSYSSPLPSSPASQSPTFIAPIAPSPAAAHGFPLLFSHPRSSPPVSSHAHSPSPSPSSIIHNVPSAPGPGTLNAPHTFQSQAQSQISPSQTQAQAQTQTQTQAQAQATHPQVENQHQAAYLIHSQTQASLPTIQTQTQARDCVFKNQTHTAMPQAEIHTQAPLLPPPAPAPSHLPLPLQHHPHSHTEVASLPQTLSQPSISHFQSQVSSQSHPEVTQVQPPYPHTSQAALQSSPPLIHPHLHSHPAPPFLQTEAPAPPAQPESLTHPPHPFQVSPHPQYHPPPPHHPHQSVPGAVPLHQLSQLYQDPLYPGFPLEEKGQMAPVPPYSSRKSGDDLPQDVNILRFFFNLGVKAFTHQHYCPYMYLLPLLQAHFVHPRLPSRSPSPIHHYPPSNPPIRHQDMYPTPQNPPGSASMGPRYEHHTNLQASPTEGPHPREPTLNQTRYPIPTPPPHRMAGSSLPPPWQQHQVPQFGTPGYPVGYPTQSPLYPPSLASPQSFLSAGAPGHPLLPYNMHHSLSSPLGYQASTSPGELQLSLGMTEQLQSAIGDPTSGQGAGCSPALLEGSAAAAHMANSTISGTASGTPAVSSVVLTKKEQGEGLARPPLLLVDPPLYNRPIVMSWVQESEYKDASVTSEGTALSRGSSVHHNRGSPAKALVPGGGGDCSSQGFRQTMAVTTPHSIGCGTEEDWDESEGFKATNSTHRGSRRPYRGRGRSSYSRGRGQNRRRPGGEEGAGFSHSQYNAGHQGRGHERHY